MKKNRGEKERIRNKLRKVKIRSNLNERGEGEKGEL